MKLNDFQAQSKRTMPEHLIAHLESNLANYGLGIVGEAGEVADEIKKVIFHGHSLDVEKLENELGDVLHYVAGIATFLGLDLEDVAKSNIEKLKSRFPDGFKSEDSIKRVDTHA